MENIKEMIAKIPLFSSLEDDDLTLLEQHSNIREYPKDNIVIYQGDSGHGIYLILKGKVKVVIKNEEGKEIILSTLKKGDYFGEMSIFDREKRSATVITTTKSELLLISNSALERLINEKPKLAMNFLADLSRRLRLANQQIRGLVFDDVKRRVAKALSDLYEEKKENDNKDFKIIPRPKVQDLASRCGATRETVSRILNEFSKQGIIELNNKNIKIKFSDFDHFA